MQLRQRCTQELAGHSDQGLMTSPALQWGDVNTQQAECGLSFVNRHSPTPQDGNCLFLHSPVQTPADMLCLATRALNGSLLNAYQLLDFTLRSWACHDEACQFGVSMILWPRGRTKLILITIQKHKLILCRWSMVNATQKNNSRTQGSLR